MNHRSSLPKGGRAFERNCRHANGFSRAQARAIAAKDGRGSEGGQIAEMVKALDPSRFEKKGLIEPVPLIVPPFGWSDPVEVFAQVGAPGPNPDANVTRLTLYVKAVGPSFPGRFAIEVTGGDRKIIRPGPATINVTITGNVVTGIKVRCRGYLIPVRVVITGRF